MSTYKIPAGAYMWLEFCVGQQLRRLRRAAFSVTLDDGNDYLIAGKLVRGSGKYTMSRYQNESPIVIDNQQFYRLEGLNLGFFINELNGFNFSSIGLCSDGATTQNSTPDENGVQNLKINQDNLVITLESAPLSSSRN